MIAGCSQGRAVAPESLPGQTKGIAMLNQARVRGAAVLAAVLALGACASVDAYEQAEGKLSATSASEVIAYPAPLHGLWVADGTACPAASSTYDGDRLMEISADRITGYEEVRTPVAVARLVDRPLAWRIESLLDIGPSGRFEKDQAEMFSLDGNILTVEKEGRIERYRRCEGRR